MRTRLLTAGAVTSASILALASAAPAVAATDEVVVTDRETVQAYLSPAGEVKVARVYDQVTATGRGTVELRNPVSTDGLRNLDGLGGVSVEDGEAIQKINVDGEQRLRTVSSFDEEQLPVTIKPTYELDGEIYDNPEDIVGKSGRLTVTYRVENVTGQSQTITVKDGRGNDLQRTVEVPLPLVGSLTTVLPRSFYSVRSDQATVTADGRGGTRMTFTMTLLPPVGSATAEFGYTAEVEDLVIPRATVSVAVVQPLAYPSLKTAADSYSGGAETGAELTSGAEEIDANLLKLRDGAGQLLGGLIQLRDGAQQLNAGLAGEAAPGANRLASGAGEAAVGAGDLAAGLKRARSGSAELADGLGRLADGNQQLANAFNNPRGGKDLVSGSQDLASGLGLISGGLAQLAAVDGLPAAQASALALRAGVDKILAGLGSPSQDGTILNGLAQLSAGNKALTDGLAAARSGLDQVAGGLPQAKAGVDGVRSAIVAGGPTTAAAFTAIITALGGLAASPDCTGTCPAQINEVITNVQGLAASLSSSSTQAATVLGQVSGGLGTAIQGLGTPTTPNTIRFAVAQVLGGLDASATGLAKVTAGVTAVKLGLSNPACDLTRPTNPASPCGVREGLTLLSNGLLTAVSGVTQLSAGAKTAAAGSGDLADGIAQAGDGAEQLAQGSQDAEVGSKALADGLTEARDGSAQLADGNRQIADGAGQLASGLDDAADGSGRLAAGLEEAADGAPALVDGAERLSNEGTKKLVEAGNDTTVEFGERYAVLEAMAERTEDGGLPFGAPEGATGSAAYSFELAAATNEGGRNVTRGLLAIAALGVGALVSTVVRARFF